MPGRPSYRLWAGGVNRVRERRVRSGALIGRRSCLINGTLRHLGGADRRAGGLRYDTWGIGRNLFADRYTRPPDSRRRCRMSPSPPKRLSSARSGNGTGNKRVKATGIPPGSAGPVAGRRHAERRCRRCRPQPARPPSRTAGDEGLRRRGGRVRVSTVAPTLATSNNPTGEFVGDETAYSPTI